MKTYKIPLIYEMSGKMSIKADSLQEAIEEVIKYKKKDIPLPNSKYISGSIEIEEFLIMDKYPDEEIDFDIG